MSGIRVQPPLHDGMEIRPMLLSATAVALTLAGCPAPQRDAAVAAARSFVQLDFEGDTARGLRLRFSPARKAEEERKDPYGGEEFNYEDPFVAVQSYRIIDVTCDGGRAEATVEFCRVGSSGRLLDIHAEEPSKELLHLAL